LLATVPIAIIIPIAVPPFAPAAIVPVPAFLPPILEAVTRELDAAPPLQPAQPLDGLVDQMFNFLDFMLASTQVFDAFLNRFDAAITIAIAVISVTVATIIVAVTVSH
jgi:hypothetical protein